MRHAFSTAALLCLLLGLSACLHSGSPPPRIPRPVHAGGTERGLASWYGEPYHGRRTASGEVYDMHRLSAAHRSLPFGTLVRVTRRDTGARVEVRINDRGPFIRGRIIDLSYAAACRIGLDTDGIALVELEVLGRSDPGEPARPPEPPEEPDSDCRWVQVGAFSDRGNAERARERLQAAGEHAVVTEGPGGLERVRVGPFRSEQEAEEARDRLLPDWPHAQVVSCG